MTKQKEIIFGNLVIFWPVTACIGLLAYVAAMGPTGHWILAIILGLIFLFFFGVCVFGSYLFFTADAAEDKQTP